MNIHLPNDKLGYYTVNDKKFYGKLDAVLYANSAKSDISWNFNKEIFNTVNWTEEPETSLLDFYKARAVQIREEYDYIILMCSGGADSTNMLYSFLKNGIHVDEVIVAAPLSGLSNWNWDNKNLDANNTISEVGLNRVSYPNNVIQIVDNAFTGNFVVNNWATQNELATATITPTSATSKILVYVKNCNRHRHIKRSLQ
jgi:hypothetical protein